MGPMGPGRRRLPARCRGKRNSGSDTAGRHGSGGKGASVKRTGVIRCAAGAPLRQGDLHERVRAIDRGAHEPHRVARDGVEQHEVMIRVATTPTAGGIVE